MDVGAVLKQETSLAIARFVDRMIARWRSAPARLMVRTQFEANRTGAFLVNPRNFRNIAAVTCAALVLLGIGAKVFGDLITETDPAPTPPQAHATVSERPARKTLAAGEPQSEQVGKTVDKKKSKIRVEPRRNQKNKRGRVKAAEPSLGPQPDPGDASAGSPNGGASPSPTAKSVAAPNDSRPRTCLLEPPVGEKVYDLAELVPPVAGLCRALTNR